MTDALVERLRARTVKSPAADFNPFVSRTMPDPDCAEAAERISALSEENERLRAGFAELRTLSAPRWSPSHE